MSIYGSWIAATIASAGTSSSEVNLGRDGYDLLEIQIPTMTTCNLKLQTAEVTGGTFYDLGKGVTTATSTFNYSDTFKLGGWQFIKVVSSVAQGAERLIRVRGMRY